MHVITLNVSRKVLCDIFEAKLIYFIENQQKEMTNAMLQARKTNRILMSKKNDKWKCFVCNSLNYVDCEAIDRIKDNRWQKRADFCKLTLCWQCLYSRRIHCSYPYLCARLNESITFNVTKPFVLTDKYVCHYICIYHIYLHKPYLHVL